MTSLEEQVKYYSEKYYQGIPEISDIEFDRLVEHLRRILPDSPVLKTGWGYKPENHLEKYNHSFHAGSLDKLHADKIIAGKEKFKSSGKLIVTPKLDGASAVAYYNNGKLTRVLSRGDGNTGNDITKNLIHTIPLEIEEKWITAIRGEVIVSQEDCDSVGGSHPRNVACGLSQSKDKTIDELSILKFVPYYIHNSPNTKSNDLLLLTHLGFICIPFLIYPDFQNFKTCLEKSHLKQHFEHHFPIDGLVLTDKLDNSIAVKFEDETAESKVLEVTWQLSRTGRMVPVLEIEPTNLRGAIIKRVTANNATWIKDLGCGANSIIEIVRANEVIPKVISVIEETEVLLPSVCPSCNSKLVFYNKDLICENESCSCRTKQVIFNIFNCRDYKGIGPAVIDSVIEYFDLKTINDTRNFLDNITTYKDQLLELLKPSKYKVFMELAEIVNSKINIKDLITSANIPNLGNAAAQALENITGSVQSLKDLNNNDLALVLPTYLAVDNFNRYKEIINQLITFYGEDNITFKEIDNKPVLKITLTGKMSRSRSGMVELFNSGKYKIEEVSVGSADYLVSNETSNSSKFQTAKKKGIKIVTQYEFLEIIK